MNARLERAGFGIVRGEGSQVFMRRDQTKTNVLVPDPRELRPGTLKTIIRDAGLNVEEFVKLLAR
jgi:predicted RNA binding protein YcfA (HicA-like mRNA interferase family)